MLRPLLALVALAACDDGSADPVDGSAPLDARAEEDSTAARDGSSSVDARLESDATPDAASCPQVPLPTRCPTPAPTYAGDIAPLIEAHCLECHSGQLPGTWPLTSYRHVADWEDLIRASMISCSMPPPDATTTLTEEQRLLVLTWLRCDLPR